MKLNLAIVEDNFIIQMFLEEILSGMGHKILWTADKGEETLLCLENRKPDLILLDIGLSGEYNGIELGAIIKEKYQIPFAFLTGNSDKSTIESAKKSGPVHIIRKPIDEDKLKEEFNLIVAKLNDTQEYV